MKYLPKSSVFTAFSLAPMLMAVAATAFSEEPKADAVRTNIFIEMQMVVVPREQAIPLVRDLLDKTKIEKAYSEIQDLLAHGAAKLVGWPMLTTQSGQRAVIEAIDEFRYATEYATGGVGVYLSQEEGAPPAKLTELPSTISGTEFNSVPAAFETRNTGVTLEVEPVLLSDGKTVQVNLVPQHVRLTAMKKISIEREKTHESVTVEQPEFDTMKVTTTLAIKSGERVLMGTYLTSDPPNHLELFILHVEVRKPE